MQTSGATGVFPGRAGCAPAIETASIITQVASISEARSLPDGSLVGDLHGGLTFSDAVAAELEARSAEGWHEFQTPTGDIWTIIVVNG